MFQGVALQPMQTTEQYKHSELITTPHASEKDNIWKKSHLQDIYTGGQYYLLWMNPLFQFQ